jgi:hypothetical protein
VHIASAAVAGSAMLAAAVCATAAGVDIGVLTTIAAAYKWRIWSRVGIVAAIASVTWV